MPSGDTSDAAKLWDTPGFMREHLKLTPSGRPYGKKRVKIVRPHPYHEEIRVLASNIAFILVS